MTNINHTTNKPVGTYHPSGLKLNELKAEAAAAGIAGRSKMNKRQLVAALKAHFAAAARPVAADADIPHPADVAPSAPTPTQRSRARFASNVRELQATTAQLEQLAQNQALCFDVAEIAADLLAKL